MEKVERKESVDLKSFTLGFFVCVGCFIVFFLYQRVEEINKDAQKGGYSSCVNYKRVASLGGRRR